MKVYNKRDPLAPPDAVYIGRPSKWGNPFTIGQFYQGRIMTREDVIGVYNDWLLGSDEGYIILDQIDELIDKDLLCWCAPLPCHGEILLQAAEAMKKAKALFNPFEEMDRFRKEAFARIPGVINQSDEPKEVKR